MAEKVRLAVLITRLVRGGAQRIALETFRRLDRSRYEGHFLTGPEVGREGGSFDETIAGGLRPIIVPGLRREISPPSDLSSTLWLISFLRRRRIQVLHTHTSKAGLVGAVAARVAGTPVVVYTPHGHIFAPGSRVPGVSGTFRTPLLLRLRRLAERWSDRVIALNRADLEEQVGLGLAPRDKYVVVPNGIDLGLYRESVGPALRRRTRASLGLGNGAPAVAVVGRLTREKGHDVLLEAFARLPDDLGPVLLVVGGGPLKGDLREATRRLGVESRVRFLGVRTDVPGILAASDLVVQPSYYESGGLALMEAMAAARPVIASRTGGIPDLVRNEVEGILVPPGEPGPLARAMEKVLRDRGLARRLADAGRRKVTRDHDIDRTAEILDELYARLLAEKGVG